MKVQQECIDEFPLIQKGVNQAIYAIENEQLVVHTIEPAENSWDEFVQSFPEDKCCHIFSHFHYISSTDNVERSKFVHVLWAPSKASKKDKMQITFFAQQVLTEIGALCAARIEAGNKASLDYASTQERILRRVTVK